MYVRLAFSVAAHITPEILLVDEVLAVGDHSFQKKCLGQMGAIARGGRTVVLVTHQLEVLQHLSTTALLFEGGRLAMQGETRAVVEHYLAAQRGLMTTPLAERLDRTGAGRLRFTDAWVEDARGQRLPSVLSGQDVRLAASYELAPGVVMRRPTFSFALYTTQGVPVTRFVNGVVGDVFDGPIPSRGRVECVVPKLPLNVGQYVYNVLAESGGPELEMEDWVQGAGLLTVEQGDFFGTGKLIDHKFLVMAEHRWTLGAGS